MIDYHIHTAMSGDANGTIDDYIKNARKRYLIEIGFSDHFHLEKQDYSMSCETLARYAKEVQSWKEKDSLPIKLGLEVDFIPNREKEIEKVIKLEPFDYVIGSVHFINHWGFDDPKYIMEYQKWDIDELNRTYFALVCQCAESGLFSIIGHLDLIKKFGYRPKADMADVFAETVDVLKENQVCVEVNTSGLRAPCKEIYPSKAFLKICYEKGIPITLGSDSHAPENIGKDFDKALEMIKEVGYESIVSFNNKKPKLVKI